MPLFPHIFRIFLLLLARPTATKAKLRTLQFRRQLQAIFAADCVPILAADQITYLFPPLVKLVGEGAVRVAGHGELLFPRYQLGCAVLVLRLHPQIFFLKF